MDLVTCLKHDTYCLGNKDIKLCNMCLNKEINTYLEKLPVEEEILLKQNMKKIDTYTCKATNASYYVSKSKK